MKNIYICSPSSPLLCTKEEMQRGVKNLEELGYSITFSTHALENNGNVSSSVENRVADLMEGFTNAKYKVIVAATGGWNSNEVLPFIDFSLLRKYKKPFIGMSDITTLCVNLWQKSDIPTHYGMNFRNFILSDDIKNYKNYIEILNANTFGGFFNSEIKKENIFRNGKMNGKLVGGNLALLCWLAGTEYELIVPENAVLFLEDDEETNGYYWQMYLTHLRQLGYFERVNGIIFGKVLSQTKFNEKSDFLTILNTVFKDYTFPIIINADFGHIDFPRPVPYGIEYSLEI